MLKRLYALTTWVVALACILLAVLVSVARLFLPLVADERATIEARVSELVGQPIAITSVEAEIRGVIPRLFLRDVRLMDPSGEQVVLRADQLVVDLDPVQSLLSLSPRLRKVSVRGVDLEVTRTQDDRIVVRGVWERSLKEPPKVRFGDQWAGLKGLSFSIGDSRLHLIDEHAGRDLVFDRIQLAVRLDRDRLRFSGSLNPPAAMGQSLELVADLRGDLAESGGWSGVIFARGEDLHLPLLPASHLLVRQGLEQAQGSVEVWTHWRQGRLSRLAGDVDLQGLEFALGEQGGQDHHRLDRVSGRLLWESGTEGGWHAQVAGLEVSRGEYEWPAGDWSVELRPRGDARQLRLSADTVRLGDVAPLARVGGHLTETMRERLQQLALHGDVRDLRLDVEWQDRELNWLRADGVFQDLGFEPLEEYRLPGLTGLDGVFSLARDWGEISLATGRLDIDYPSALAQPVELQRLLATVRWQLTDNGWQLQTDRMQIDGEDLEASGVLALEREGDTSPTIDLQLDFKDGEVARARNYFPRIMREKLRGWLETALRSGHLDQGQLVLAGQLDRFPFRDGGGRFETRFEVSDVALRYRDDWPELREMSGTVAFSATGMQIEVTDGRLFDTRIGKGRVSIADFRRPVLEVRAQGRGPLADGLRYMAESDIARRQAEALALVEAKGPARLELALDIPLSPKLDRTLTLNGHVALEGVSVDVPSAEVTIRDLRGEVDFTRDTLEARGITGRLNDAPLTLGATRPPGGDILISGEGVFRADGMLSVYAPELAARLEGQSRWFAHLNLPIASGGPTELDLTSGLEGVTVALPAPLGKSSEEMRSLTVGAEFGAESGPRFRIAYGTVLSSVFDIERDAAGARIGRAEVRLNGGEAALPKAGVRLAGSLASLDLAQWREALGTNSEGSGDEAEAPEWLSSIDLTIDHLNVLGRSVNNLRISADREPDAWRALVSATPISGVIVLPHNDSAAQPLELELEHLDLDMLEGGGNGEGGGEPTDPRALPSLRVSSSVLVYGGQRYRNLRLETSRQATGQQVHVFQLEHRHGRLRVYGEWRARSVERQRSSFRFEAGSNDVGTLLEGLGFDTGISGGKGQLDGDLSWRGAPYDFELVHLKGKTHLLIEDGRLTQVDPGAGRFIGLLNLSTLPRRLSLDFSDVFREGFAFDRIEGNLSFDDEAMYTNDLKVDGPAAKVTFTGRTDIAARTYDQTIIVRPEVGATLPVAGALLGGATVGAAVFVLQKILPTGGDQQQTNEIRYHMTGSWEQPVVERISGPETDTQETYNPWESSN